MGFRSTLTTFDFWCKMPDWLEQKHTQITVRNGTLLATKSEFKIYSNEIFEDYQKAIKESGFWRDESGLPIVVAVLHEDGEITKVVVSPQEIKYYKATEYEEMDSVWMGS